MTHQITHIALHYVGNKTNAEALIISASELKVEEAILDLLSVYFSSPFKTSEYYNLYHDTNLELNEVYSYVSEIFVNPCALYEQSKNLAKHLFEKSNHPKIKGGEFYVVYFPEYILEGKMVEAVGLFKSENRDTFLKVYPSGEGFGVESEQGVNINRLDKGCLIYNSDKENGYVVSVVDNTNKGTEAHYWIDDFIHAAQRKDEYYKTQNVLLLCKNFVCKELPENFELSKADQADLLNKSVKFFKEKESFDIDEFTNDVIGQPELIDCFNKYKEDYKTERDIEICDNFSISESAVKRQSRMFKSVIKLDRNFHIYVHGDNQFIKKGYDQETGMHFYQLYFNDEQ